MKHWELEVRVQHQGKIVKNVARFLSREDAEHAEAFAADKLEIVGTTLTEVRTIRTMISKTGAS